MFDVTWATEHTPMRYRTWEPIKSQVLILAVREFQNADRLIRMPMFFDSHGFVPNPIYDFVLCWGVLNHVEDPRKAFNIVASQVKNGAGCINGIPLKNSETI